MQAAPDGAGGGGLMQHELRRVFDTLAGYAAKQALRRELEPKAARRARILEAQASGDTVTVVDERGREVPPPVLTAELRRLDGEIAALQRQLDALAAVPDRDKRIRPRDLQAALAFLGHEADKVRAHWERPGASRR